MTGPSPRLGVLAALALAGGCKKDDDVVWAQFNADGARIDVHVGAEQIGGSETIPIYSCVSVDQVQIGEATVDPTAGPLFTNHQVSVQVSDRFDPCLDDTAVGQPCVTEPVQDIVGRVTVRVEAQGIGVEEYDLRQDSASVESWSLSIESGGPPGDVRTDTFEIFLWEPKERGDEEADLLRGCSSDGSSR